MLVLSCVFALLPPLRMHVLRVSRAECQSSVYTLACNPQHTRHQAAKIKLKELVRSLKEVFFYYSESIKQAREDLEGDGLKDEESDLVARASEVFASKLNTHSGADISDDDGNGWEDELLMDMMMEDESSCDEEVA